MLDLPCITHTALFLFLVKQIFNACKHKPSCSCIAAFSVYAGLQHANRYTSCRLQIVSATKLKQSNNQATVDDCLAASISLMFIDRETARYVETQVMVISSPTQTIRLNPVSYILYATRTRDRDTLTER